MSSKYTNSVFKFSFHKLNSLQAVNLHLKLLNSNK